MDLEQAVGEFRRDGFVRIRGLLSEGELRALRHDTQRVVDGGYEGVANRSDYRTAPDPDTGEEVFNRVQFVFPLAATKPNPLLGHPQVQALSHALLGDDALCNAEALVFKLPGNGSEVPVQRRLRSRRPAHLRRPSRVQCRLLPRRRDPGERLPAGGTGQSLGAPLPRPDQGRRVRLPGPAAGFHARRRCPRARHPPGPRLPPQSGPAPAPYPLLRVPVTGLDAARRGAPGRGHVHRRHLGQGADPAHAACH